jgi:hypothetical protein
MIFISYHDLRKLLLNFHNFFSHDCFTVLFFSISLETFKGVTASKAAHYHTF